MRETPAIAPYIDLIDVPHHAPLKPWKTPESEIPIIAAHNTGIANSGATTVLHSGLQLEPNRQRLHRSLSLSPLLVLVLCIFVWHCLQTRLCYTAVNTQAYR